MDTNTDTDQIDSLVDAPQQPVAAVDGDRPAAGRRGSSRHHTFRRRGPRSAQNLARRLKVGRQMTPAQDAQLGLTCRLICHAQNISLKMFLEDEARADGEPRVLLTRLMELERAIRENLTQLFGDDAGGDLSALMGRQR